MRDEKALFVPPARDSTGPEACGHGNHPKMAVFGQFSGDPLRFQPVLAMALLLALLPVVGAVDLPLVTFDGATGSTFEFKAPHKWSS